MIHVWLTSDMRSREKTITMDTQPLPDPSFVDELRKRLATVNVDLRVEQIRPLMFAVAKHFSVNEAKLAFRLFVHWARA